MFVYILIVPIYRDDITYCTIKEGPMNKLLHFFILVLFTYKTGTAQEVGAPAPDFTHNTLSHGTISLSDYQGQVVYLFFFGWG